MKEITTLEFEKEVLKAELSVLDFYSTECPPCEALAPKYESIASIFGDKIKFLKIYRQGNRELAEKLNVKSSPTVLFFKNGEIVGRLTGAIKKSELIQQLGKLLPENIIKERLSKLNTTESFYDVIVLGGGPAGLTAALYLCQAKVKTVLIDPKLPGGNVSLTHMVSNYPGFINPINGYHLAHNMAEQSRNCGVDFKVAVDINEIDLINKKVVIDEKEIIRAEKIIIAMGTSPRLLNVPGEIEYKGNGISYCATCDAKYYEDKDVIVVGGGNSAIEEALFIANYAKTITIVHQFKELQANRLAQEKAFSNNKFRFYFAHEPRKIEKVNEKMIMTIENLDNNEYKKIEADGIFIFIGLQPNTNEFKNILKLDQNGYIIVDQDMRTNLKDIFAIGDIISKKYRQITTAVADGTIAAMAITHDFIKQSYKNEYAANLQK